MVIGPGLARCPDSTDSQEYMGAGICSSRRTVLYLWYAPELLLTDALLWRMMVLHENLHLPSSDLNGTLCVTNFTQVWDIVLLIVEDK